VFVALDRPPPPGAFGAWHLRGPGDFWAHMLVAEGAAEIAIDAVGVSVWDVAAPLVIVEEAGGRCTDADGDPRPDGRTAVSTNGRLHEEALALLAASR
jgi:histidinol-phosphatase